LCDNRLIEVLDVLDLRRNVFDINTAAWRTFVREKYGTDPTVTYFESPVVVDNVAQQILTDE